MRIRANIAIGAALLLAGCGGGDTGNATGNADTATAAKSDGGMPSNWKASDACSILDNAAIESVLGVKVNESSLALVHEPTPGTGDAATSECTYILAQGRAQLMTRWSPIKDNTKEAIDLARSTMKQTLSAFGGGTVEDIAGLGKASIWVAKVNQLQTFIGEDRMVLITVPNSPDAKDKAIALAKKAGA